MRPRGPWNRTPARGVTRASAMHPHRTPRRRTRQQDPYRIPRSQQLTRAQTPKLPGVAIYPETNGYTGSIDLGFDGRGNRIRVKRRGRTKAIVRERLAQVVADRDAGIKTSDGYTVGEAARDWLEKGTRDLGESTV